MDSIAELILTLGQKAKTASRSLRTTDTDTKNSVLRKIIANLQKNQDSILVANNKDLAAGKSSGLDDALLDRLMLNSERINGIIESLEQIITLPDPIGETTELKDRPSGIQICKMRVSIGVIGIIYESRPNVTIDAAALCLKSGNAVILRGGSEAIHSNLALYQCIKEALSDVGLDSNAVQIIDTTDREAVTRLVQASDYVDAIIPRGGKGLIENISNHAKMPVIKHLHGVCHTYLDKEADSQKAIDIAFNGKTRRYGVCNATETLLVHKDLKSETLSQLIELYVDKGVELRGCQESQKRSDKIIAATEDDWSEEYLAPILSVRIVDSLAEAISHIEKYGSSHTDAIVTENKARAKRFMAEVDSSSVMVNASTAFADGFEYGLGAEIGISTDKFHVRGPVGLEGLTSQKYIVQGDGHTRP
ncbi:MAG TPA: glutamate-5-semialdehyde dehydrogenase [Gammaproteobacteria bacterium]|jgi:glutamate-5-semialdehyde dehydrogenase|nr:glutamate-5-semialdehyde dehydrogenase [Gammaproteobacteria bacterium]